MVEISIIRYLTAAILSISTVSFLVLFCASASYVVGMGCWFCISEVDRLVSQNQETKEKMLQRKSGLDNITEDSDIV